MLFLCKQRLFFVYVMNQYVCDDLIKSIHDYFEPYQINIKQKEKLIKEILIEKKKSYRKGGYRYDIMWNVKPSYSMIYQNKNIHKFLNDTHDDFCGCFQCLCRFDYPRYVYLMKRCRKPMRGTNTVIINNWILFLSYLSGNKGEPGVQLIDILTNIPTEIKHFGFVSKYDLQYNMITKKKRDNVLIQNMRLKSDKNKWIQLLHIWENIQLL